MPLEFLNPKFNHFQNSDPTFNNKTGLMYLIQDYPLPFLFLSGKKKYTF